jgi:hypothetical protein
LLTDRSCDQRALYAIAVEEYSHCCVQAVSRINSPSTPGSLPPIAALVYWSCYCYPFLRFPSRKKKSIQHLFFRFSDERSGVRAAERSDAADFVDLLFSRFLLFVLSVSSLRARRHTSNKGTPV